jgi:hypothetical protein
LTGAVADRPFKLGNREIKLSEVHSLRLQPGPQVLLQNGQSVEGSLSGLEAVPLQIGADTIRVNLAKAVEVAIEAPKTADGVTYAVVASQKGTELHRLSGTLTIQGAAPVSSAKTADTAQALLLDKTIQPLPAPVADLAVGGGGRFLLLHLPSVRKLAVFDTQKAKLVHFFNLAEDAIKFAAGEQKLIIILPATKLIQRWDLSTFEREASAPLPIQGVIKAISMGSASDELLLVHSATGTQALDRAAFNFIDIHTLKVVSTEPLQAGHYSSYRDLVHIRASADGRVYGLWCTSHSPQGLMTIVVSETKVKAHYEHTSVGHIVPGSDGQVLFTGSGLYTNDCKPFGQRTGGGQLCIPAPAGNYYYPGT